ncbi:hypothetical protein MSNKSG1_00833 [Marinobacter santoriniensis NKSG1]|uniref:Uncharacterized protein n=1 Tax=Marinobacter santoriniensis NKSG1 TaxID=1288826 RepID=M7D8R7_9GAMM|nr:hypothetical protein [Marinobacter santoriniensis]EMP57123.1 hypothetical protein MSNKSG1_00833 [Marinobacter santoriniensis NKSG1]
MAISFYEKGELTSGFHGWRVVATIRGKRYQKYFSLKRPNARITQELWYQYQETRAKYYEARYMARSAALQYLDFIGKDHPTTLPCRGVGFQGITLGIGSGKSAAQETCYFSVNKRGAATKFYIDERASLSQAWEQAVKHWGEVFDIRPKDIAKKLEQVPSPDQFKSLRKQLNDREGCDYQASVLHHVYAEQRSQLEKHRAEKTTRGKLNEDDLLAMYANLERQVSEFRN